MAKKRIPMGIEGAPLTGVVLAGGLSSRMGHDKALLRWQGRPLLEHQTAVLQAAGAHAVKISGKRPDYHGVADVVPQAGPVVGIASVAATCVDGELLIVPVDMPRLQPALLQRLGEAESVAGCVRFADHVLPMRLRLDAHCRHVLDALLTSRDERARSLQSLQERVGIDEIALSAEEAAQLIDCNTQATWRELNA